MPWYDYFWTAEIEKHLGEHRVTAGEFEEILGRADPRDFVTSRSNAHRLVVRGFTGSGRWIVRVFELIDGVTVLPVTAYEPTSR